MQIQDDDLERFVTASAATTARLRECTLLIPSTLELSESQLAWLKSNGIKRIEKNGKVVEL